MTRISHIRAAKVAGAALALCASMGVAGCGEEAATEDAVPEGQVAGIAISNARLVLPPVSGNPAAVYFDLSYDAPRGISISGAEVEGASGAEVHEMTEYNFETIMVEAGPIALAEGTQISFEPGGFHIMAFELPATLEPGDTAEVTLKISGGGRHRFDAEVRAAGEER